MKCMWIEELTFRADVFDEWNKTELDSFLTEITRDILRFKADDGTPLVEKIRDAGIRF
jgi:6-phosphogluconate dehydrogenase